MTIYKIHLPHKNRFKSPQPYKPLTPHPILEICPLKLSHSPIPPPNLKSPKRKKRSKKKKNYIFKGYLMFKFKGLDPDALIPRCFDTSYPHSVATLPRSFPQHSPLHS